MKEINNKKMKILLSCIFLMLVQPVVALDLDKFTNTIKQAVELLNENVQEGHDSKGSSESVQEGHDSKGSNETVQESHDPKEGSYVEALDNYTTIEETVEWLNQNMKLSVENEIHSGKIVLTKDSISYFVNSVGYWRNPHSKTDYRPGQEAAVFVEWLALEPDAQVIKNIYDMLRHTDYDISERDSDKVMIPCTDGDCVSINFTKTRPENRVLALPSIVIESGSPMRNVFILGSWVYEHGGRDDYPEHGQRIVKALNHLIRLSKGQESVKK